METLYKTVSLFRVWIKGNRFLEIKISLYGLKWVSRNWFSKLLSVLLNKFSMTGSIHVLMFVSMTALTGSIHILIYVTDILVTGDDSDNLKLFLYFRFHRKDFSPLKLFISLKTFFSQPKEVLLYHLHHLMTIIILNVKSLFSCFLNKYNNK